jgi:hypothetical protein
MNKDNTIRRTYGDHNLIYSMAEKGQESLKNCILVQKRRDNVNGIKLVEFSKVGGPKVCHLTYF